MERWGTPKDIAEVALFLCSPAASFVSGQIIPVNGGFKKHAN
jgi:NAD(P)-dependent dehydrogenase (short-subunit alcohol dehydrogenase family)